MKRKLLVIAGTIALLATGAVWLAETETLANPICPFGWTCSCTSSTVPDVVCATGEGTPGSVVVTVCQKCPPPCPPGPGDCHIQACRFSTSATCE